MRSLLIINDKDLREKAFSKAVKLIKKLERLETNLESFYLQDQHLFDDWFDLIFRDHHKKMKDKQDEYRELCQLHNWIIALMDIQNISFLEAWTILRREEEIYRQGTEDERQQIEENRKLREDFINSERKEERTSDEDPSIQMDLFDSVVSSSLSTEELERLKIIYRKLVRHLHPDFHEGSEAQAAWQKSIWLRAQSLYQDKNTKELENLWLLVLIRSGQLNDLSFSEIHQSQEWLIEELNRMEFEIKNIKSLPAWGFSRKRSYDSLQRKLEKKIIRELKIIEGHVNELKMRHDYLKTLA